MTDDTTRAKPLTGEWGPPTEEELTQWRAKWWQYHDMDYFDSIDSFNMVNDLFATIDAHAEEIKQTTFERDLWKRCFDEQFRQLTDRAEKAEGERDAALAEVERLKAKLDSVIE